MGYILQMQKLEKIFGKHSVRAVFLERPDEIRRLIFAGKEDYHAEMIAQAQRLGVPVEFLSWPDFLKIGEFTEDDKHQGVCAFVLPRTIYSEKDFHFLENASCVLMLDQISNPQNMATILRGAAFFGADAVVFLHNRSVGMSPTVVRYAVGGAEFVKVFQVTNLSQSLVALKKMGFWVYGLDERGKATLAQTEFPDRTVFVVGAEGEGLRPKTRDYCDALVRIPGGREGLESLNAAVAVSVSLYEFYRTRLP